MRNILIPLFAFITLLVSIASCHSETPTNSNPDSTCLRIAVLPTADCLPLYIADSLGLFDSLDVDIQLLTYEAAMDADTAFRHGWVDGCVTDLVKATTWRSVGDSLRAILCGDLNLSVVTARTARIREVKSLKEKVIGVTRNSIVDYTVDQMLDAHGMIPKDLNRPQINNICLRQRMVDQNQYDGAILPEPYASLSVAHGAKRILKSSDLAHTNPSLVLVFRDSLLRSRPNDLLKVVKAYDLAIDYINTHRSDSANTLLRFLPLSETFPDSVYTVPSFYKSQLPSDSLLRAVHRWCQSRSLLGQDTTSLIKALYIKQPTQR